METPWANREMPLSRKAMSVSRIAPWTMQLGYQVAFRTGCERRSGRSLKVLRAVRRGAEKCADHFSAFARKQLDYFDENDGKGVESQRFDQDQAKNQCEPDCGCRPGIAAHAFCGG